VAPPDDSPSQPGGTPVPPRGTKRKPNRPTNLSKTGSQRAKGATKKAAPTPPGPASGAAKQASGPSKQTSGPSAGGAPRPGRGPTAGNRPVQQRRQALAQQRRRRQTFLAAGAIAVVIIVVAVFVIIKATGGSNHSADSSTLGSGTAAAGSGGTGLGAPVSASVYSGFAGIKPSALAAAANNAHPTDAAYPSVVNDPPITKTGKPTLFYFGAEFCPFCATERWPIVLALSQFGTFKNLTAITSDDASGETYKQVPTFSFYKSTYTSKYLTFTPVETETVSQATLQTPTAAQEAIVSKYDSGDTIPFVYFNGKAIISGAQYDPSLLLKGSFGDDAQSIIGGASQLSTSVYFNAGAIVSDICAMTGGQPGNVCSAFPKPITG
jgi:thiol-disulfide isomerase/thioredoxin